MNHATVVCARRPAAVFPYNPSQAMTNEIAPTLLHEDQGFAVSTWKNVLFIAWGRQATVALVNKAWELTVVFLKAHPEGCSCVHITFDKVPLADAATRDRFQKFSQAFADEIAGVVCIVPGTGFWASALRSSAQSATLTSPGRAASCRST